MQQLLESKAGGYLEVQVVKQQRAVSDGLQRMDPAYVVAHFMQITEYMQDSETDYRSTTHLPMNIVNDLILDKINLNESVVHIKALSNEHMYYRLSHCNKPMTLLHCCKLLQ